MKENDEVFIRNSAGKLKVILDKKLSTRAVTVGYGEDSLPTLKRPRMEFHKQYGEIRMITLYDNEQTKPTIENPNIIYVIFLDYGDVEVWEAHFNAEENEEYIYETVEQ